MRTIYKYGPLRPTVLTTLKIHDRAMIRHVGVQRLPGAEDGIFLWAEVEDTNPMVEVSYVVVGTGFDLDKWAHARAHLGTVITPFVWHVYSVQPSAPGTPSSP